MFPSHGLFDGIRELRLQFDRFCHPATPQWPQQQHGAGHARQASWKGCHARFTRRASLACFARHAPCVLRSPRKPCRPRSCRLGPWRSRAGQASAAWQPPHSSAQIGLEPHTHTTHNLTAETARLHFMSDSLDLSDVVAWSFSYPNWQRHAHAQAHTHTQLPTLFRR